jgi:hypothetical protein
MVQEDDKNCFVPNLVFFEDHLAASVVEKPEHCLRTVGRNTDDCLKMEAPEDHQWF